MLTTNRQKYKPEELFEKVSSLVVSIRTEESSGSGVIFGSQNIIATNRHVIEKQRNVVVGIKSQRYTLGKVLRSYLDIDLAFVQADISGLSKAVSSPTSSQDRNVSRMHEQAVRVGETVFAIGHPLGLEYTFTKGIASATRRLIDGQEYLQIDASINPGNSGGGLFNSYGELVGINTMGYAETQGLNFAIPADRVKQKYDEMLIESRKGLLNYCPTCGFSSEGSKYCENCGSSLSSKSSLEEITKVISTLNDKNINSSLVFRKCRTCGFETSKTDKYCTSCGSNFQIN